MKVKGDMLDSTKIVVGSYIWYNGNTSISSWDCPAKIVSVDGDTFRIMSLDDMKVTPVSYSITATENCPPSRFRMRHISREEAICYVEKMIVNTKKRLIDLEHNYTTSSAKMNETLSLYYREVAPTVQERERRWLVPASSDGYRAIIDQHQYSAAISIQQNYFADGIRTRRAVTEGGITVYTMTTKKTTGIGVNEETETEIPLSVYHHLKATRISSLNKVRYIVPDVNGKTVELDVFSNGLIIAEVEFDTDDLTYATPSWFGDEITGDTSYSNFELSKKMKGAS